MLNDLLLLPMPRNIAAAAGEFDLSGERLIVLDSVKPQTLRAAAECVQQALSEHAAWSIVASPAVPAEQIGLRISVVPDGVAHAQGYRLLIEPTGITIIASTAAGAWYGALTLAQIIDQSGAALPCGRIDDWPDFPVRGAMLDISRNKVPTLDTLRMLIDELAGWKINQLQLYTEHTFAYRQHPDVWRDASPLTGEDILLLDAYCRERHIELVPNQNTFGHMRPWLIHDRYRALSEAPDGCDTIWGRFDEPFTLCPDDPGSLELVRGLLDELLPHFSSRQVNIGADETVDLGQGRSAAAVAERGVGRVYLDFLLQIHREVKARGRTMQFWGDVIISHPELLAELPRDAIALEWGYEADHPFAEHAAQFAAAGLPFYVCPGTSSWNALAGRTDNALENLRVAAEQGLKHGAVGYLVTDWGDNGHWQPLPVSYLGFASGAALAWCAETNRDLDLTRLLDLYVFHDSANLMGRIAYDLGNVYQGLGSRLHNSSVLFRILQSDAALIREFDGLSADALHQKIDQINAIIAPLDQAQLNRPDAELIAREYRWIAAMLLHACRRGIWALNGAADVEQPDLAAAERLNTEQRDLWLARNRPGGLDESQGHWPSYEV